MIYFEQINLVESEVTLWLLSDHNGNGVDVWVFDDRDKIDGFRGHLSSAMFDVLRGENIVTRRESIFAAAEFGSLDDQVLEPNSA